MAPRFWVPSSKLMDIGSWSHLMAATQTLVTYASYVDGGFLMPQPLVRRQCRIDMPEVMTTLKAQAEVHSGVQIAGRPQARGQ
jgi:hypothetical protein